MIKKKFKTCSQVWTWSAKIKSKNTSQSKREPNLKRLIKSPRSSQVTRSNHSLNNPSSHSIHLLSSVSQGSWRSTQTSPLITLQLMSKDLADQIAKLSEVVKVKLRNMKTESKYYLTTVLLHWKSIRKSCKSSSTSSATPTMRSFWNFNSRQEPHHLSPTSIRDFSMKKTKGKNKILFPGFKMRSARHHLAIVVMPQRINTRKALVKTDSKTWVSKLHMFLLPNPLTAEVPPAT